MHLPEILCQTKSSTSQSNQVRWLKHQGGTLEHSRNLPPSRPALEAIIATGSIRFWYWQDPKGEYTLCNVAYLNLFALGVKGCYLSP